MVKRWWGKRIRAGTVIACLGLAGFAVGMLPAAPANASTIPPSSVKTVTEFSALDSNPVKTVVANCPAGKKVLGGGGLLNAAQPFVTLRHVMIIELRPFTSGGGDGYLVSATEDEVGTADNWAVAATAICGDPLPGWHIITTATQLTPDVFKPSGATCPAGQNAVGGGGRIEGGNGEVMLWTQVNQLHQVPIGMRVTGRADEDGFSGSWGVVSYAVCVTASPDLLAIEATSDVEPSPVFTAAARIDCPTGMVITTGAALAVNFRHIMSISV